MDHTITDTTLLTLAHYGQMSRSWEINGRLMTRSLPVEF